MSQNIHLVIVCGGKSVEHEVSLNSALRILREIKNEPYKVSLIAIDKQGTWHACNPTNLIPRSDNHELLEIVEGLPVQMIKLQETEAMQLINSSTEQVVFFPISHGTIGEDGSIQGLFEVLNLPYVGANVLGSAIGMDKDISKRLLMQAGIYVAPFKTLRAISEAPSFQEAVDLFGLPFFIKPASKGSSVGVSKVKKEAEYFEALEKAFSVDEKVLIEQFMQGREIEVAVLGSQNPITSLPGEVAVTQDFYTFEAKYLSNYGTEYICPAKSLTPDDMEEVRKLAIEVYKTLECEGLARVDFFFTNDGKWVANEINTLPGFTPKSMYPMLFAPSGITVPMIVKELIQEALARHERKKKLKFSFQSV